MNTPDGGVVIGSEAYTQLISDIRTDLTVDGVDAQEIADLLRDEHVVLAVRNALKDWNSKPPPIGDATLANHPAPGLLRCRAMALLLRGHANRLISRGTDFSDGGAQVSDTTRAQLILGISDTYNREYHQDVADTKKALNAQMGWGSIPSAYAHGAL